MNCRKRLIAIRDSIDLELQNHTQKIKDSLNRSLISIKIFTSFFY